MTGRQGLQPQEQTLKTYPNLTSNEKKHVISVPNYSSTTITGIPTPIPFIRDTIGTEDRRMRVI